MSVWGCHVKMRPSLPSTLLRLDTCFMEVPTVLMSLDQSLTWVWYKHSQRQEKKNSIIGISTFNAVDKSWDLIYIYLYLYLLQSVCQLWLWERFPAGVMGEKTVQSLQILKPLGTPASLEPGNTCECLSLVVNNSLDVVVYNWCSMALSWCKYVISSLVPRYLLEDVGRGSTDPFMISDLTHGEELVTFSQVL